MPSPGYKAKVKRTGSATSMTDEACTEISGTEFQITNSNKRRINPYAAVTVKVDGVSVASSTYEVDYLFGKITFDSSQTGSVVTITAEYLLSFDFLEARGLSLTIGRQELDTTVFDEDGAQRFHKGLETFEASVDQLELMNTPADGSGGTENSLVDDLKSDDTLVFEAVVESVTYRAFVYVTSIDESQSPDGLYEATVNLAGTTVVDTATARAISPYGWE